MGGKLLSSVWSMPEKRLSNDDYEVFKARLISELKVLFPENVKLGSAPAIRQKESHGDLDIICGVSDGNFHWAKDRIEKHFGFKPNVNSNVLSFPVDGFQVDVTFVPFKYYQSSIDYSSWGDLSNLVGRIAHKFGLHHGHIGLSFWIRQSLFDQDLMFLDNDHIMDKFSLSQDYSVILPILGFDYDRWKQGFDSNEEVYHWVASSKFFNVDIFAFENLNNINRVRNKKRAMYAGFIEWLENNSWKYEKYRFETRGYYIPMWVEKFPELKSAINEQKKIYLLNKKFKEKLNGYLVMNLLGIENGAEVGKIIGSLKQMHSKEEYISMPQEQINELILKFKK